MLQKILAIIGCVFLCLILSVSLGVGATILVDTIKENRAQSEETVTQSEEAPPQDDGLIDEQISPDAAPDGSASTAAP